MPRISKPWQGFLALAALSTMVACENELPTTTGPDLFPGGLRLVSVDTVLTADEFLVSDTLFTGLEDPREAPYLLVAEEFDGVLDAHALARFSGFPDTVTFSDSAGTRTDSAFTYSGARIVARVQRAASDTTTPATLQLYSLGQTWTAGEASWLYAAEDELWREPGGTTDELLAEAVWVPTDTASADSIVWEIGAEATARLAEEGFPGVLVQSATAGSRVQLTDLVLRASLAPESRPDTTLTRTVAGGPRTFVFTPEPPQPESVFVAGGITSDRTLLRFILPDSVSACAAGVVGGCGAARISLGEVSLNALSLVLEPRPVPDGFRPLAPVRLTARRIAEPELGLDAPLGEILASDSIPASAFLPGSDERVELSFGGQAERLTRGDTISVVLLLEGADPNFGYAWFSEAPEVRLVYTLPLTPSLP